MSHWRVRQRYGFGAGNVLLQAQLHRHPARPDGLLSGARRAGWEMWIGTDSPLRRSLLAAPVVFLSLLFLGMLALNIFRVPVDQSDIQVVMLEYSTPMPQIEQEVAEVPPPPPPEPPTPRPPRPPEAAPPKVAPRPPAPRPAEVKIAAIAPPPLVEPERTRPEPMQRAKPKPEARPRPRVRIDAVRPAEVVTTPQPTRRRNVALPSANPRSRPRVDLVAAAAPAPQQPAPPDTPRQRRAFAPVEATPSRARPSVDLQAVPAHPDTDAPVPERAARTARPRQENTPRPRRPSSVPTTPTLAAAAPALPASDQARPRRTVRKSQLEPSAATNERSMHASALDAPSIQSPAASTERPPPAARAARMAQAPAAPGSTRSGTDPTLRGVSLGSLAACLSDREEDSLKQQLVAAVTTQQECISSAGTYRFVETKNLNAFLMWIERTPGRREADRCEELRLALACLATGGIR